MAIDPRAVQDFLGKPRDSFTWMKGLSEREVDDALAALDPRPNIRSPLMLHQKVCFLLGVAYPAFFFMLDMGTGKTLLTLELMRYWLMTGKLQRGLVFAPTDEVVGGWEDEIRRWAPDLPYECLLGSSDQKASSLGRLDRGLAIVTYPGFVWLGCDLERVVKKSGKAVNELVPNKKKLKALTRGVNASVWDESTKVAPTKGGSAASRIYRLCNKVAQQCDIRYALAGRAFGRDPATLWPQFNLVDGGDSLGPTLGLFRAAFFDEKQSYFGGPYSFEYKFRDELEPELTRMIGHRSLRYMADECLDLPELSRYVKAVHLPNSVYEYRQRIIAEMIAARGNYREVKNTFLQFRQLSSGFIGFKDDETGEKAAVEFDYNPKLELLLEMVSEVPPDCKWLIFHEFTFSGRTISERLRKEKIKHGWVWGGEKHATDLIRRFNSDPDYKGLILNHKKGSYGLNLQQANYVFIYESPVSGIDRDQMERRAWRKGQTKRVFMYDLVTEDTMDRRTLAFLKEGADLYKHLVDDPARVLAAAA